MSHELPLVVFTILAQAAIGSFFVLALFRLLSAKNESLTISKKQSLKAFGVLFPLVVLAMLASLAHLGHPLRAPLTIFNLGSSWLSREIFFVILFALCWLLYLIFAWRKIGKTGLLNLLIGVGIAAGILDIFSMSRAYMLVSQPAWDTLMTPLIFYGSALALGGSIATTILFLFAKKEAVPVLQWGTVTSMIGTVLALVGVVARYLLLNGSGITEASASAALIRNDYLGLLVTAIIALALGLLVSVFVYIKIKKQAFSMVYANLGLLIVAVGLVFDRLIFYSAHIRIIGF